MTDKIKIKVKRLSEDFLDVPLPYYATSGSAGMDIRAALKDDVILQLNRTGDSSCSRSNR